MAIKTSRNPDGNLKRSYRRVTSDVELVADTIIIDGLPAEMFRNFVGVQFFDDSLGQSIVSPEAGTIVVTVEPVNGAGAVKATGVLTGTTIGDLDTVTIDGKVYTFDITSLDDTDGHVLLGATDSDSLDNLVAAITLGAGAGTLYATSTTLHPTVTAAAGPGDTLEAAAKTAGSTANAIATTEALTSGSWANATLTGGDEGTFQAPAGNTITAATPIVVPFDGNLSSVRLVPTGITVATHWRAVWTGNAGG